MKDVGNWPNLVNNLCLLMLLLCCFPYFYNTAFFEFLLEVVVFPISWYRYNFPLLVVKAIRDGCWSWRSWLWTTCCYSSGNYKSMQDVVINNDSDNGDRMLTKENRDGSSECHWRLRYSVVVTFYWWEMRKEGGGRAEINCSNFCIVLGWWQGWWY